MDLLLSKSKELARRTRDGVQRRVDVNDPVRLLAVAQAHARPAHHQDKTMHTLNAQRLLGDQMDVDNYLHLKNVKLMTAAEPFISSQPASVEEFLKAERQNALISAVTSAQEAAVRDFHQQHFDHLQHEWEHTEKAEIRKILGVELDVTSSSLAQKDQSNVFQDVIEDFVGHIIDNTAPYPIVERLKEAATTLYSQDQRAFVDCLEIVQSMLRPPEGPLHAAHYAKLRTTRDGRQQYVQQMRRSAITKLQERYRAKLAGADLESFARAKRTQHLLHDMTRDDEQWAVLFYALRMGLREEALHTNLCQQDADLHEAVASAFAFQQPSFLRTADGRSLYERGVLALLSGSPDNFPRELQQENLEDYLWFKLRSLPENDVAQYTEFQKLISKSYGESHFQAARNPWNYLFALLFTAQFERAVEFLQRVDLELAVHLAIPLHHYGALDATEDISENTLVEQPGEVACLYNFGLLVQRYARLIMRQSPATALNYLYLVRSMKLSSAADSPSVFVVNFADVILENNDLALLGGYDTSMRQVLGGDLVRFMPDISARHRFLRDLAIEFRSRGKFPEAIRLFQEAQEDDEATNLLIEKLTEVIILDDHDDIAWSQYLERSRFVPADAPRRADIDVLENVVQFIYACHRETTTDPLFFWQELNRMQVFPLHPDEVDTCMRKIQSLGKEVSAVFPSLIFYAMRLTEHKLRAHQQRVSGHFDVPEEAKNWQQRGRALLTFAVEMGHTFGAEKAQVLERLQLLVESVETSMRVFAGHP
ncbi:hypothetical protein PTSG_11587 [Salpingoeca rosetta]|uniref:Nuclear pore protein n=1 Tax=Salpingoeca rosetta (strain ATCC 50818 / BSB-021) TaxID=946362 RepID=F2TWJ9_SALR5|nr:uncharacterized protein PTSG_11587 [Salpingoeca rosetta]EGD72445.1 hypothetical protein PTSG_11587 [Salpingoeca rosetta]|eukprot:XP_004999014.1 hypothetical protein PTSG_11587 [Salpingoeca rosetta]